MPSEYITRVAEECGLTPFYIEKKVAETRGLMEQKGLVLPSDTLIGYDVQGPMTKPIGMDFYPWINVRNATNSFYKNPNIVKTIISGWDLTTLRNYRDTKLGGAPMSIIGELGCIYEDGEKIYEINPIDRTKVYEMLNKLFIESAEAGLKLGIQGNESSRYHTVYFEAERPNRGDLTNHFLVKGKDIQTLDVYHSILCSPFENAKKEFEYEENKIIFEPSFEATKILDYVLRHVHTLQSVRFSKESGSKISIKKDKKDMDDFELKDMEVFAKGAISSEWEIDPNADFCVDIIYKEDGFKPSKESAANVLAKRKFDREDFIISHTGDKKADVFLQKNTLFFPLYGTSAEEYCIKENIPHVPVISGVDYSLVMAEMLNAAIKEYHRIPQVVPLKIEYKK